MYRNLVCPECGCEHFTAVLTTRVEYTYQFMPGMAQPYEVAEELIDGGDLDEVEEFTCADCGTSYEYPQEELVTDLADCEEEE